MAQRVDEFATKSEDMSSISRTHEVEGQDQPTPASRHLTSTQVQDVCAYT